MDGTCGRELGNFGICKVCCTDGAQYTCPRCELKTCSLKCVSMHKKECSVQRHKIRFLPLSEFTDMSKLRDYRALGFSRKIRNSKRNRLKKFTGCKRPLSSRLWLLRSAALRRKTTLHFLPKHFTRCKENTSFLDFKSGIILWKLELIFPQGDNIKVNLERCSENDRLSLVLSQLLDYDKCPDLYKNHLKFYHSCGISGVEALVKAENIKGPDSFLMLDLSLTLKENFENMVIIEHPIIYVILRDHKDEYMILDPDRQNDLNGVGEENEKLESVSYFDSVSYTYESMGGESAEVITSSCIAELKKYFAADGYEPGNDVMDNESIAIQNEKAEMRQQTLDLANYDDLVEKIKKM